MSVLSGAAIQNLEKLGKFFDAGFLDATQREAIKSHAIQNRIIDEEFWSHVERVSGLLSSGVLTVEEHKQDVQRRVEALLGTGESRSTAVPSSGSAGGGEVSDTPEKTRR